MGHRTHRDHLPAIPDDDTATLISVSSRHQQQQQQHQPQKKSLFYKLKSKNKSSITSNTSLAATQGQSQLPHQSQLPSSVSSASSPTLRGRPNTSSSTNDSYANYYATGYPPPPPPPNYQHVGTTPMTMPTKTSYKYPPGSYPPPPPKTAGKQASSSKYSGKTVKDPKTKGGFLSLTKKATKLAGDLAFGSANINMHEVEDKKFEEFRVRRRQEQEARRLREFTQLKRKINEQSTLMYIKHFKFVLEYMGGAEFNDPLKHSITRRDLFISWYEKFLVGLREDISKSEDFVQYCDANQLTANANCSSGNSIKTGMTGATANKPSFDRRMSDSTTRRTSISSVGLKLDAAIVEQLTFAVVHDNKTILILLWYIQILKKLLNQPALLQADIQRNLPNIDSSNLDPSIKPEMPEICVISLPKMTHFAENISPYNKDLISDSILTSNVEFVDGWLVRHDNPGSHTNFITITDKFRVLIDLKNKGHLTRDMNAGNPEFKNVVLDKEFLNRNLSNEEFQFLNQYSSFTSKSPALLPLKDDSQSCVMSSELSVLINDESQLLDTLYEFKRVMKRGAYLQLNLWDLDLFNKNTNMNMMPQDCIESLRNKIWDKASKFVRERNLMLPNITTVIIPMLKKVGFKKIKYTYMAYPQISTLREELDSANSDNYHDKPSYDNEPETEKGFKDPRFNSFFELFSNYTEFVMFTKILSILKVSSDAKCYQDRGDDELPNDIEQARRNSSSPSAYARRGSVMTTSSATTTHSHGSTEGGSSAKNPEDIKREIVVQRVQAFKDWDYELLHFIKLFIDYKLHGCTGELVRQEFGDELECLQEDGNAHDDSVRNEGFSYMMVLTAEK